ncbi:hypothetical protein HF521_001704, partial [Silurus meridionalis]
LAGVLTDIFNLSLAEAVGLFKTATDMQGPKNNKVMNLNDFHLVTLHPSPPSCFERPIFCDLKFCLPHIKGPSFEISRSVKDCSVLEDWKDNLELNHLGLRKNGNYTKMLFVDYSSAFNTIIPSTLTSKLEVLGLSLPLCQWISNFLTDRPQAVRVGKHTSSTLTLSTGAPQGCVLSPLLYTLYTYDCVATSNSTTIIKFADDTVVVGLISNNNETAYLQEVKNLERWCQENNLLLNVSKTKELIVDFSMKQERSYQPLNICGIPVERVDSFRYLGVHHTGPVLVLSHQHPGEEGPAASVPSETLKGL